MLRLLVLLLGCLGCARAAWVEHPVATPPDRSCRVGVEAVTDYYIWDCLDGEHIVISQFGSYFGPRKARKEVARCGELTAIEKEEDLSPAVCEGVPEKFFWNAPVRPNGRVSRF
jgi:hypothetical protein